MNSSQNDQAIAERREAIAAVMANVDMRRARLATWIEKGHIDKADVLKRSTGMPGVLGDLWREFINLQPPAQLEALSGPRFRGTTWQALLQCTPYFEFPRSTKSIDITDAQPPGS